MAFWAGVGFAGEPQPVVIKAEAQEKVAQLLQAVIENSWSSGAGTNTALHYSSVEAVLRAASKLMPSRLDLRFGIASSLLSQAIQTNGLPLEIKVKDALRVYQEIQTLDPTGFEAPILYAAYTRAIGETNASETAITGLKEAHPQRTQDFLQRFERADRILQIDANLTPSRTMSKDQYHAVVVLGAGLETNGTMKAKLVARLEQALKLARMYPGAPIILTGGNQKSGVTEAYTMSLWLAKRGIPRKQLILEDRARDTVENALYSAEILQKLGATHVTLVTSASHVRRGLVDLQEACLQRGLSLQYDTLAARTRSDTDLDKEQERVGVYRDLMRVSGLWAYPGIQR